jgi:hypothetical protein
LRSDQCSILNSQFSIQETGHGFLPWIEN